MKKKFRREIFIETEQIAIFSDSPAENFLVCRTCRKYAMMLQPHLLAGAFQISTRDIYQLIETGSIHFIEDEQKRIFVCLRTLAEAMSPEGDLIFKLSDGFH
ncbi:MAG: hypothetical protein R2747_17840 [Pyrinomonadaceae bacterium]